MSKATEPKFTGWSFVTEQIQLVKIESKRPNKSLPQIRREINTLIRAVGEKSAILRLQASYPSIKFYQ